MERPKQGLVRRRTKLASSYDKKIANDEFMAAAIGDVEWLRQSLRSRGGVISYDQNVSIHVHMINMKYKLTEKNKFTTYARVFTCLPRC